MTRRPTHALSIPGAFGLLLVAAFGAALVAAVAVGLEMLRQGVSVEGALLALQNDLLLLSVCQLGGVALAIGVGVIRVHGADARFTDALDVRAVPAAIAVLAITAGLAMQFPLSELANLLAEIHPGLGVDEDTQQALQRMLRIDSARDAIVVPLAVVAIPAISEELLFRGLILPGLIRRHRPAVALGVSSVLFGAVHVMPAAFVYASVAGLLLGLVRLRTGSVLPCVAMHGAFNAVPVLLPAELVRIEGFNTTGDGVYHLPLALTLGGALLAALCLVVMTRLTADVNEP